MSTNFDRPAIDLVDITDQKNYQQNIESNRTMLKKSSTFVVHQNYL